MHSLSKCGCSALQCPHQGAKNTTSAFLPLMAASKLPVSREETQLPSPISPSSAAAALIRQAATARSKTLGARRDGRMLRVLEGRRTGTYCRHVVCMHIPTCRC